MQRAGGFLECCLTKGVGKIIDFFLFVFPNQFLIVMSPDITASPTVSSSWQLKGCGGEACQ